MAMVSMGFEMTVFLTDRGLNTTTKHYQLTAATAADAATDAAAIIPVLAAVTSAAITGYSVGQRYADDAVVLPPSAADAQVEVNASCTTYIDNAGSKKANFTIPAPTAANVFVSTVGANSNIVNIGSAQVIAYHGLFMPGGRAYISDGEVAGVLIGGVRTSKRARQG